MPPRTARCCEAARARAISYSSPARSATRQRACAFRSRACSRTRHRADACDALRARLDRPTPRIAAGIVLRERASSCIDVSDGLLADLGHVARASGVGIDIAAVGVAGVARAAAGVRRAGAPLAAGDRRRRLRARFHARAADESDVLRDLAKAGCGATRIGRVVAGTGRARCSTRDGSEIAIEASRLGAFRMTLDARPAPRDPRASGRLDRERIRLGPEPVRFGHGRLGRCADSVARVARARLAALPRRRRARVRARRLGIGRRDREARRRGSRRRRLGRVRRPVDHAAAARRRAARLAMDRRRIRAVPRVRRLETVAGFVGRPLRQGRASARCSTM